jgi:hypothetical protein
MRPPLPQTILLIQIPCPERVQPPGDDYPSTMWLQNVRPGDGNFSRVVDKAPGTRLA